MSVEAEEKPVAPSSDGEPVFRVVTAGGRRRGVRLERVFWEQLALLAEKRGMRPSRLAASVIEAADAEGDAVTSALRVYVARALAGEIQPAGRRFDEDELVRLMQLAPVPAFAINRQKQLKQVNAEFLKLLRLISGDMSGSVTPDRVHLTLDTPVDELFVLLAAAPSTVCTYSIQTDMRKSRGRARIVLVPSAHDGALVGYVVS